MSECNLTPLMMLKLFTKNLPKEGFEIRIHTSKKTPRSDNVTSCIYVCCSEGQGKTKNALDSGLSRDDENKTHRSCSSLRT